MNSKLKMIIILITVMVAFSAAVYAGTNLNSNDDVIADPAKDISAILYRVSGNVTMENQVMGELIVSNETVIEAGTTIKTGEGAVAEVSFEDGSSFRIEENTTLVINTMKGITVTPVEGEPFASVYSVIMDLKTGKIYGDLAPAFYVIPNGETPIRIEVDMPWGIAGIRGTIWSNEVFNNTQITSVLRGKVEVISLGKSVYLTKGHKIELTSEYISEDMLETFVDADEKAWEKVHKWIERRETIIEKKKQHEYEKELNKDVKLQNNPEEQIKLTEDKDDIKEPEINLKPKTNVKPESVEKPKTNVKPESVEKPKTNVKPESVEKPKTNVKPETNAKPETIAKPESVEKPETNVKPETNAKPETVDEPEDVSNIIVPETELGKIKENKGQDN